MNVGKKFKRRAKKFRKKIDFYGDRAKLLNYINYYKVEDVLVEHTLTGLIVCGLFALHFILVMSVVFIYALNFQRVDNSWLFVNLSITMIAGAAAGWYTSTQQELIEKDIRRSDLAKYLDN